MAEDERDLVRLIRNSSLWVGPPEPRPEPARLTRSNWIHFRREKLILSG